MLNEKRVKEAESNVRKYLTDGLLKKEKNDTALQMYVENSELSLMTAQKLFSLESKTYNPSLWIIVTSYYSMYYIANAVLLKNGYKVGTKVSHKVTSDSLIVFIRSKLKNSLIVDYEDAKETALEITSSMADEILQSYEYELEKRSKFQYQMDEEIKKGKAQSSFERAKKFLFEMKKLLK